MRSNEKGSALAGFIAVLVILGAILGLITLFTSMRFVGTGEIGVVTSYGKVTGRELTEGFAWVGGWGTNNVTKYDIKTQKEEVSGIAAATRDLQDVTGTVVLNYQLEAGKVSEIHKTVGVTYKDKLITPALNEVFKAATAKYNASELITKRAEVKSDITTTLTERLKKDGISVTAVNITNFSFSAEFNKAIEAVQVANQEVAKAKQQLEKARIDAEKTIQQAKAAAEAQRLQQQTLTSELLYKQWVEKWDGKLPEYVGGNAAILNLPKK